MGSPPASPSGPTLSVEEWDALAMGWMSLDEAPDAAHDLGHLRRVLSNARRIAQEEGEHDPVVLTCAALLHDCVSVPKDSPLRSRASALAAERASALLAGHGMSPRMVSEVAHAILAHSYSARIAPLTPEARALQDADRIDALGAIGIARCFAVSGALGRALFDGEDPLAVRRPLDEGRWALDHFQTKLLRLPSTMSTGAGRRIAEVRATRIMAFMEDLAEECSPSAVVPSSALRPGP